MDFSQEIFEIGGFSDIHIQHFSSPIDAAETILKSKSSIGVLCDSQQQDWANINLIINQIRKKRPQMILVLATAGDEPKIAGVDELIYPGIDCIQVLNNILVKVGIPA